MEVLPSLNAFDPFVRVLESGQNMTEQQRRFLAFDAKFVTVQPSFDVPVAQNHLSFMKAIYKLFVSVDPSFTYKDPTTGYNMPSPTSRAFLSKAVERYHAWIIKSLPVRSGGGPLDKRELPPIDVLAILHAHMLSPGRFLEDIRLRFPELGRLGPFPLSQLASQIDIQTGHYSPLPEQVHFWEESTGLPYDHFQTDDFTEISCPACAISIPVAWVESERATHAGKGYGEQGFGVECHGCSMLVNHAALSIQKFTQDLIACQQSDGRILIGNLTFMMGQDSLETATFVLEAVMKLIGVPLDKLGEHFSWSMNAVKRKLDVSTASSALKSAISELLRPYDQSSPFSTDLPYKATLQAEFAATLSGWGWLDPSFLLYDEVASPALAAAIRSYHIFLKLVLVPGVPKIYPSPSIDLIWHTHQLLGSDYSSQTLDMVGVFVDHLSMDQIAPTAGEYEAGRKTWKALLVTLGVTPGSNCPHCGGAGCDLCKGQCGRSASQPLQDHGIIYRTTAFNAEAYSDTDRSAAGEALTGS